jgi:predicted Zn-dependent protease
VTPRPRPGFIVTALVVMFGCFLAAFVALWVLWSATWWVVDRLVDFVPPAWEEELGKKALAEMDNHGIADPVLRATVQDIAKRLVAELPKDTPYHFTMTPVWKAEANAFALPGGSMLVTSGLLAEAESPDEVAGVLGHEIGHVIHRHSFRSIARDQGVSLLLAIFVGDDGTLATIAKGTKALWSLGNSRENELQSDRTGVELAYQAGFQPKAMGDFFRRQQAKADVSSTLERALAFLSTHPANADRLDQLEAIAAKLPPRARSDFRAPEAWSAIRARATRIPPEYVAHDRKEAGGDAE